MRIDASLRVAASLCPLVPVYLRLTRFALVMFAAFLAGLASPLPGIADDTIPTAVKLEATKAVAIQVKRSVVYKTLDSGTEMLADVYLPPASTADEGRRPTLLMIHGGAWFSGNKVHVSYHARHAAEQGYAVVAINYRLAPKYKFPAQLEDCRDALRWLAEHADEYQFDKDRIAVYGYSAGAHLACLVGVSQNADSSATEKQPPQVRAVVAGGAPCEFSWIPTDAKTLAYWLGDSRQEKPEVYAAATPLRFVDEGDPPVFLFHGTADRIVPLQSSQKMTARLTQANVTSQLHTVQKASHLGAFLDTTARAKAIAFLDQYLRQ